MNEPQKKLVEQGNFRAYVERDEDGALDGWIEDKDCWIIRFQSRGDLTDLCWASNTLTTWIVNQDQHALALTMLAKMAQGEPHTPFANPETG